MENLECCSHGPVPTKPKGTDVAVVPESDGSGSEPRAFIVSLDGTPVDTANALIADTLPDGRNQAVKATHAFPVDR